MRSLQNPAATLRLRLVGTFVFLLVPIVGRAQQTVSIVVDGSAPRQPLPRVWRYFGYDEPNYTYAPNGRKLLGELAELSPSPVYIRMHNLLTSGDGTAALKWGSTNVYTEDANGQPVYDWKVLDEIFDTLVRAKVKPLVEIGFMPEALSAHPQPYRHDWPKGPLWTGWAYPPKDYRKWAELVYRWVRHAVDRYGKAEVESWKWEVWNEPDIGYWQGTWDEYYRLYDYSADAVKRALPEAPVGGPHSTGPVNPRAAEFLRRFLDHCARGTNYATGGKGAPLDFVAFQPKGSPKLVDDHVRMGISHQLQSIAEGFQIVASSAEFKNLPIILGESDPEGCAACSARVYPQNAYRNGQLYACYTAEALRASLELAAAHKVHLEGVVTWAFEFENQPYFDGFRTLATNGIDKPVLNVFRMLGLLGTDQIPVEGTPTVPVRSILESGVGGQPDINAIATVDDHGLSLLVWNYHDDILPAPDATVNILIKGLPRGLTRVLARHYRIDEHHSNAYAAWKEMGSPQRLTDQQYKRLSSLGRLQQLSPPQWKKLERGEAKLSFPLPRHGVSLLQLAW
jgi:xylan 1,4-beta-xylosidase